MQEFTSMSALAGGVLVGLAAALFLLAQGRIAGISGLLGGLLRGDADERWSRMAFVGGLLAGGLILRLVYPAAFQSAWLPPPALALTAGVLVGFGTQLGSGCTSGHGVCGVGRLSPRSLVATGAFMLAGFAAVYVGRHLGVPG